MLLLMAIILTFCSAILELALVIKFAPIRKLIIESKWAKFNSLAFSFLLSVVVGAVFGASGLVVFIAGVASTLLTEPFYVAWRKMLPWFSRNKKNGGEVLEPHQLPSHLRMAASGAVT